MQSGDELFIAERYEEALQAWRGAAGGSGSKDPRLHGRLAAAHLKLAQPAEAEAALAGVTAEDEEAAGCRAENLYRRGLAALGLSKHRAAKAFLTQALAAPQLAAAPHLRGAITAALATASARAELDSEAPEGSSAPVAPVPTAAAPAPAVTLPAPAPAPVPAPAPAPAPTSQPTGQTSASQAVGGKPRVEWFQSPTHVFITYMCKGANEKGSKIAVKKRSVEVELALPGGSEYTMDVGLFAEVVPGEQKVTYMASKVEVALLKAEAGLMWPSLEPGKGGASGGGGGGGGAVTSTRASSAAGGGVGAPAAPALASAYASKKDWSRIEKELDKDEEDKPQGEAALQALFQQIYANADEDTRRAMVKSFQTSGGTVLSTNWKDVAQRDFEKERVAPDGAVAKKWSEG